MLIKICLIEKEENIIIRNKENINKISRKQKQSTKIQNIKKYGLTEYTFNELLKKQKNKCKIWRNILIYQQ